MDTVSSNDINIPFRFGVFKKRRKLLARAKPISVQLDEKVISKIRSELARIGDPKIKDLSNSYTVEFVIYLFEIMITRSHPEYIRSREMIRLSDSFKSNAMKQAAKTRAENKRIKELEEKFLGANNDQFTQ